MPATPKDPKNVSGERLRAAREAAGLKIADVAKRWDVYWNTIQRHELGINRPEGETYAKYAELYGRDMAWLMGRDPEVVTPENWSQTRKAVEDFLASPLGSSVTPVQAEALRHINLNAVSPTIHTIYEIWKTTSWDVIEAHMVDGKVPSARGAKIPGRKPKPEAIRPKDPDGKGGNKKGR